jgi:nitrilase
MTRGNIKRDILKVGLAQIAPVWLNREKTVAKVEDYIIQAADNKCQLVVFGEALIPGYPFWVDRTDGARFNSPVQKEIHAHYLDQAVQIESNHLGSICAAVKKSNLSAYIGIIERPQDRGGHSLYCSLVFNPISAPKDDAHIGGTAGLVNW